LGHGGWAESSLQANSKNEQELSMSINSAMLAGVSGLIANSSAMAVISDNIANANTTGFKRSRTDFTRLVNAQNASTSYNAGGVSAGTRQLIRNQGNITQTTTTTDMAISGQGFFVVSPPPGDIGGAQDVLFTRAGSFAPNEEGDLVNQAGYYLQGWRVAADGTVPNAPTDLSQLETVNIAAISGTAQASTRAGINGNLRASTAISTAAAAVPLAGPGAYNAGTNNMTSGAVRADASWTYQVYDSRGGLRTFNMQFLKGATANEWHVEISASPASDVVSTAPLAAGQVAVGTLRFTPDGRIDAAATTPALLAPISLGGFNAGPPAAGQARWANATGVDAQTISLDIGQTGPAGGITQYDSPTAVTNTTSDGAIFGDLAGLEVDREGFVTAIFNNGVSRRIYQVPVATFVNPDGLQAEAGGAYRVTQESGNYNMKATGTGGAGLISSSALEASTVDLALEFSNMIITQRAYSASSKIITTADEMIDELIRMKR
jgi:flagellar hook protein FlgE